MNPFWAGWKKALDRAGGLRELPTLVRSLEFRHDFANYLREHPGWQSVLYWTAATVVGFVAVLYAEAFAGMAAVARGWMENQPVLPFLLSPILMMLAAWLVLRFAPGAAGSGIPQVMSAIDLEGKVVVPRLIALAGVRVIGIAILSSLLMVLAGGSLGREGTTIHIAAGLFLGIGYPFRRIWPQISHSSLLIAGGAAGIAAAFNTPLGGIVFAIEELSEANFHRFKTYLISAVIVSGLVAQWLLGPYLYFGFPKLAGAGISLMPWALFLGVVTGALGGLFGKVLFHSLDRVGRLPVPSRLWLAAGCGLLVAAGGYLVGPSSVGGGDTLIRDLLFTDMKDAGWGAVVARFFGPIVSSITGASGGVFAPSLTAGAVLGSKFAALVPSAMEPNLAILLGMIGFLAGFSRAPFTSFVLVLEMTDRHSAIFGMMLAALVASIVGSAVDRTSFYHRRKTTFSRMTESL